MSQLLIQHYLNQLADLRKVSGTNREMVDQYKEKKPKDPTIRIRASAASLP